jgi:hypothetical protein
MRKQRIKKQFLLIKIYKLIQKFIYLHKILSKAQK